MTPPPVTAPAPIQVLHLEDTETDHLLVREMLGADGLNCEIELARNRAEFETAVQRRRFDLIFRIFPCPRTMAPRRWPWPRSGRRMCRSFFFSGTIGEETAVESLKTGATDYVVKQRPHRLVAAVRRALHEAGERRRREQAETILRAHSAAAPLLGGAGGGLLRK